MSRRSGRCRIPTDYCLLILDFPGRGDPTPQIRAAMLALAESIAGEPGLIWKLWTHDGPEGQGFGARAGGVYLFDSRAAAEAYHQKHAARLGKAGVTGIEATYRRVDEALSRMNRGPL
ncbi:YdhR family protein [Humitalea sp. 24SJ18S-53]|uniref:YdhR family protein n=1 Tax=Humitalea sp. 24SJ18S-53 TaxID=3422307 RepID=UPI003D67EFDE